MSSEARAYIAIDLKSFYASAECCERGLDPLTTNLVVADASRTEKTICLAVSPSLKALGIPGRPRLFEVVEKVRDVNARRRLQAPNHCFTGASSDALALRASPSLSVSYITATPRMAMYLAVSARIYDIYLRFVAPEDIHVYSIDEVFIDVTSYLRTYRMTARELAMTMIRAVLQETGITATAGVAPNLYLCKIAMDIVAKHSPPDKDGVRIAELDEQRYRRELWSHTPLTDFWRIGRGYASKLAAHGLFTMGDVARCSVGKPGDYHNEELLYKLFGINAELLIDHAWGCEPCTMAQIKAYQPRSSSLSTGQVLPCPYPFDKGRLIVREMTDLLALDLVEKGLVTDQLVLCVGYDNSGLDDPDAQRRYAGEITADFYDRSMPAPAHGSVNLPAPTSSARQLLCAVTDLYERIVDKALPLRRVYVIASRVTEETAAAPAPFRQLDLFTDYEAEDRALAQAQAEQEREKKVQHTLISLHKRFGRNAVLKGMNLEAGATTIARNGQIGGHKA